MLEMLVYCLFSEFRFQAFPRAHVKIQDKPICFCRYMESPSYMQSCTLSAPHQGKLVLKKSKKTFKIECLCSKWQD